MVMELAIAAILGIIFLAFTVLGLIIFAFVF
jgi:hypothetical protein